MHSWIVTDSVYLSWECSRCKAVSSRGQCPAASSKVVRYINSHRFYVPARGNHPGRLLTCDEAVVTSVHDS